ncbi:MAG TPA: DUF4301 family protein, partial [Thermoanaerobaculia bacterium]|nr:DUF4301 family protein [Thermoanaerobaculia bacterium]
APGVAEDLFSSSDLEQMAGLGVAPAEAARQIELFTNPPPFTRVLRPCTPGDGVRTLSEADHPALAECFREAAREGRLGRLVPASGAATRMFKELLACLNEEDKEPSKEVRTFFDNLPRFAFREALAEAMARDGHDLDEALRKEDLRTVLSYLLTEKGLNYADLPKGLLLFHRYPDGPRTPFEEHLVEAAETLRDESGVCRLHFTVSPEHEQRFRDLLASLEGKHDAHFDVTFSRQKHSTDTIAVDPENRPFRQEDGTLLFRPGGHGALLDNLNDLGAEGWDVVQLKNIDNVVPDSRKPLINQWKELLGGYLVTLEERAFRYLDRLEWQEGSQDEGKTGELLDEVSRFLAEDLSRPLPSTLANAGPEERRRFLIASLDRPLRVCGVVKNQGEPGGGPFWVESSTGGISPQIVETPQIDPESPEQQAILKASTHFSPVDIVCGLKNRHGKPYDLHPFVDPTTVFIASKSHEGRPLKALERPGLWNGSMAGWNTVFVEVPDATFAPVKTVLDLLRPEHQG